MTAACRSPKRRLGIALAVLGLGLPATVLLAPPVSAAPGILDTTFDTDGKVTTDIGAATNDEGTDIAVQPDGRSVVAGSSGNDFAVVRYTTNGGLDTTFDTDGKVTTDVGAATADDAFAIATQADGKLVVAGLSSGDFAVVRYSASGGLDTTFDTDGKVTTDVGAATDDGAFHVAVQPDGRIVAAGYSGTGGTYDFALVRYNANGSLDATFDTDGKVTTDIGTATYDYVWEIALQADGKIVAAGWGDGTKFSLARYNANGGLDTSFNGNGKVLTDIGAATNDESLGVAIQPDGKIVAGGTTSTNGGDFAVVRYEGDPAVSIGDASVVEGDFGTVKATFSVTLSGAGTTAATVAFATASGTATSPADFASTAGTLTFAPGDTSKTVTVPIVPDGIDEVDETFVVNLTTVTNIAVVADGQGKGTIVDDDGDPGYWLVASDGGIFAFNAPFSGSTGAITLNKPIVGMAADPDGKGYWLVASDGGIFAFDAPFFGSTGAITLNKPIVGMAATRTGKGYFLVASDGGIFAFGDAVFKGSTGAITLNKPVVGMAADPDGSGYYLVASDGGIFAFDAAFKGSTGAITLNKPIVGMAADADGSGYYLVASDGGIFAFDAVFKGSTGALTLNKPIVGMTTNT
jgi:uncharacterized delta-60 repeat protein